MNLSLIIEQNKKAIREDEMRKRQALEQFRAWIRKHPFIKKCRQDDNFLLMFLRTRKYSMDATTRTFESHFLLRKKHPEWFDVRPSAVKNLKAVMQNGYFYFLKDFQGQTIFCMNAEKFDTTKFGSNESFHVSYIGTATELENEVTQIMGFTLILNYTNTTMAYFSLFSVVDIVDWVKSTSALPGRYKKFIIIGLPSFANTLLNMVKLTINEKQRDRLFILNNYEELHQHVDPSVLPTSLGGTQSEEKIVENFISTLDENLSKLKSSNDFLIDESRISFKNEAKETIGSFRKLEID